MSQRFTAYTNVSPAAFAIDPSAGWSVCGWLYLVSSSGGDGDLFFAQPSATPGSAYAIRLGYSHNGSDPTLRFRSGNGVLGLNHTIVATTGAWYHLALTHDGTTARAYLDGALVASAAMVMAGSYDQADLGDFAFGTSTVELGQVKVWQGHALSVGELADEMAYWTPQTAVAQVYAWWQLDNAAPTLDSSGNSRTLSGPGSSNGVNTVPGQLTTTTLRVAALGGTVSNGVAVVKQRMRVQAIGATLTDGSGYVRTSVPSAAGSAVATGGRQSRRGRR